MGFFFIKHKIKKKFLFLNIKKLLGFFSNRWIEALKHFWVFSGFIEKVFLFQVVDSIWKLIFLKAQFKIVYSTVVTIILKLALKYKLECDIYYVLLYFLVVIANKYCLLGEKKVSSNKKKKKIIYCIFFVFSYFYL